MYVEVNAAGNEATVTLCTAELTYLSGFQKHQNAPRQTTGPIESVFCSKVSSGGGGEGFLFIK